jgi:uncharacterized cupin superfamily protein
MANLFEPEWDGGQERPGFSYRRAKLGAQAGAERLGASLYEIPPGNAAFPYHWHSGNEELLIVAKGRPTLRTPEGSRELEAGEVISFQRGPSGAHQLVNRSEEPVLMLVVGEMNAPDMVAQPDSEKLLMATRPPGGVSGPDDVFGAWRRSDEVDYWEGEEPPGDDSSR